LQSVHQGAFCVAKSPGSTAEARGREVIGSKAKNNSYSYSFSCVSGASSFTIWKDMP